MTRVKNSGGRHLIKKAKKRLIQKLCIRGFLKGIKVGVKDQGDVE